MGSIDRLNRKRAFKLRLRRHFRVQKKQVEELGAAAEEKLENDFFKRLERLGVVRRFVLGWMLIVVLLAGCVVVQSRGLNQYYQHLTPVPGGVYKEGILGAFTNASPIYATDLVDASVSKLLFAGLFTYNQKNELIGDLADSWQVDDAGTTYTVHLRDKLTWHDGQPLTSADALFTYQVIQNPDARSPLYSGWQDIKMATPDALTITFTLPNPLASFPYHLTNGLIPKHILGDVPMVAMRSQAFNSTQPVGAGPFKWRGLELTTGSSDKRSEIIALEPFEAYQGGKPKLNSFIIRSYRQPDQLINSFRDQEVDAIVGLTAVPDDLSGDDRLNTYSLPLSAAVMVFFRSTQSPFSDANLRQALVKSADRASIMNQLGYSSRVVREPLLRDQLAYDAKYQQAVYDPIAAAAKLDEAGWKLAPDGWRYKDGQKLTLSLTAQSSGEYSQVAKKLVADWRKLGINAKLDERSEATFQKALSDHSYQAILYGISIGVDPDVFAYWHSSQADVRSARLNLSEYKSGQADASLEAGRTRLDPNLRRIKYQPFLEAWRNDAPAIGLYEPRFLYLSHNQVHGLTEHPINSDYERFTNVHNWQIREEYR